MLVGESGLLLSQLIYAERQWRTVIIEKPTSRRPAETISKTIKKKLAVFEIGGASPSNGRRGIENDSRNPLVEDCKTHYRPAGLSWAPLRTSSQFKRRSRRG